MRFLRLVVPEEERTANSAIPRTGLHVSMTETCVEGIPVHYNLPGAPFRCCEDGDESHSAFPDLRDSTVWE